MRTLAGLCWIVVLLLCPCAKGQEPDLTPTKRTFNDRDKSLRMELPTKRIYGDRFHRNIQIPGPIPVRRSRLLPMPRRLTAGEGRPPIAPPPTFEHTRADTNLLHRSKLSPDDLMKLPDQAPLALLENPRRFDPCQVTRPPACIPIRPTRYRNPDRTVAIPTADRPFSNTDHLIRPAVSMAPFSPTTPFPEGSTPTLPRTLTEGPTIDPSLVGRDVERAVAQYRAYLAEYPDDFHAARTYALALLARKDAAAAAGIIAEAYAFDPLLVREPIDPAALGLDDRQVAAMVTTAQSSAARIGGKAWLLVVVLHQGRGDLAKAAAALRRAEQAGLSPDLLAAFESEFASGRRVNP